MFLCEIYEIVKNTFFYRTSSVAIPTFYMIFFILHFRWADVPYTKAVFFIRTPMDDCFHQLRTTKNHGKTDPYRGKVTGIQA